MNNTDRLCMGCMNDNGGESVCPICGYDAETPAEENCLPVKSWISERFLCGRVYEKNGESITYLGWDNTGNSVVYIKEYFPQRCAARASDGIGVTIENGKEFEFNNGLMQFMEISKKLSELEEASAVMPVIETLEMNGTAYSVIRACTGITLREFLLRNGGLLRWEQARPLFMPLIASVEALHKAGIYHFGISPETIVVGRDGKLHLFGICIPETRHALSEFTSQLFPGFAAAEQYTSDYEMGTHTDVYGIAATLFRVLIGNPPMAANERLQHDNMSIPAKIAETIPPYVLSALANALQIIPENRTSTMQALRASLTSESSTPSTAKTERKPHKKTKREQRRLALIASVATAGVLLVIFLVVMLTVFRDDIFVKEPVDSSSIIQSAPSVPSVGEVDPNVSDEPVEKLYPVPDFSKKTYSEIVGNIEYNQLFVFKIGGTKFSDTVPEGAVIEQSIKAGESVKRDTEIELIISTGSAEIAMPNLIGKSNFDAYVELLELGFAKENIVFLEKHDETKTPLAVIETEVPAGTKISRYAKVIVFLNSWEGEPADEYDVFTGDNSSN